MGWKTEQGPTPNSRVKKLKNKLGRLSPAWLGGASSAGGIPPPREEGTGEAHVAQAKPAGTWHGIEATEPEMWGEHWGFSPGLQCEDGAVVPCPSRAVPHGEREKETGRGWPLLRQGCLGVTGRVKVHRGKGRVRSPERGEHLGGPKASSRWRGIPQKRPPELHGEQEKEQERKRVGWSAASGPAGMEAGGCGAGV